MNLFITNTLTGIALSMDAMSLAIIYGSLKISKKKGVILSFLVGIYHFFMPIIGNKIGIQVSDKFSNISNVLVATIFIIITIQMIISLTKEEKPKPLNNIIALLFFAFTVSLDSLTVGIGLGIIKQNILISSIIFSTISCGLTYLGLKLGNTINKLCKNKSPFIGIVILIILAIYYLFFSKK